MKKLYISMAVAMLSAISVSAQNVGINADGSNPNGNAILDLKSPGTGQGKGLLIPRLTQAQRTQNNQAGGLLNGTGQLYGGAAQGLMIYQTDGTEGFYYNISTTSTPSWVFINAAGVAGPTGPGGAAGSNGSNGSTGPTGPAGANGATGLGLPGITGAVGATGPQGSVGATGGIGPSGAQGSTGPTGPQGPQGTAGTNGAQGPQGTAGTNGAQGPQGVAGNNGAVGATGPQGTAGTNGAQGPQGVAGTNGSAGAQGPQGTQGVQGNAGAQGIQGNTGPTGPTTYGNGPGLASGGPQAQGNFGQFDAHGAFSDFNVTPNYWGWTHVTGNTNGPSTNSAQWYRQIAGLGNNYPARGVNGYSVELAYPRNNTQQAGTWMRVTEGGTIGGWTRLDPYGTMAISASMQSSPDDIVGFTTLSGDDVAAGVTMPFSVTIGGTSYNTVTLTTNGYMLFGTTTGSPYSYSSTTLPSANFINPVLCYYMCDMVTEGNAVRYGTIGNAGNRTFIVDFQLYKYGVAADKVNGQVQIHEGSSMMNVKYRSTMSPGNNGQNAVIGFQVNTTTAYPITSYGKVLDDNRPDESWSIVPIR